MATSTVTGIRLAGIACAVPSQVGSLDSIVRTYGEKDALKIAENTGVFSRHVATQDICTSDLCYAAASRLLGDLNWSPESLDLLVVVTQTPDYFLPATSTVLHRRLGLEKHCATFDINLGCSGYVYGLWVTSHLISSGAVKRGLLLAGDTITKIASPLDRSVMPLFGDAGSATAIEFLDQSQPMTFVLGTDGSGTNHLIVPAGAFRAPHSSTSSVRTPRENENVRSDEDLYMNGTEIFTFTLREVPGLVDSVLRASNWTKELVDMFVFHQANRFMLDYLVKRMKLPRDRVPLALEEYGNTSSASIPLTMVTKLAHQLGGSSLQVLAAGFGVGFSWGAVTMGCGPMVISDLVMI